MTGRYSFHWQLLAEQTRQFVDQQTSIIDNIDSTEDQRLNARLAIESKKDELASIGHELEDIYKM